MNIIIKDLSKLLSSKVFLTVSDFKDYLNQYSVN